MKKPLFRIVFCFGSFDRCNVLKYANNPCYTFYCKYFDSHNKLFVRIYQKICI